ncbi:MAG: hypothetical protein AAF581_04115 [Planctomycetota bacterium]
MMTRRRLLGLVVVIVALMAGSLLQGPILERRVSLRLTVNPDIMANLPPQVAFTQVLLGGFRGLAVDFLWARSTRLEVQGKYHEALQLAEWITTLQPHFAGVWEFQAHNLAYDVAVSTLVPEERWHWVQSGVRLLRDDALELNPTDRRLHRALAWLYYDKISSDRDTLHFYFKRRFATEWHDILGPPPAASSDYPAWLEPHRERLQSQHRLDVDLMADLVRECGPLDWRHPATHGLYWLLQGRLRDALQASVVRLPEAPPYSAAVKSALQRFYADARVGICAQDLVVSGRVVMEPFRYEPAPEVLNFLERVETGFHGPAAAAELAPQRIEHALIQLLSWYHFAGDEAAAEVWRGRLQQEFSRGQRRTDQYQLPIVELLLEELLRELEGIDHLRTLVNLQLYNSLQRGVTQGRRDVARRYREFATILHQRGPERAAADQTPLPGLDELFFETVAAYLIASTRSCTPQHKSVVWKSLPQELRTQLRPAVEERTFPQARHEGLDPAELFPR